MAARRCAPAHSCARRNHRRLAGCDLRPQRIRDGAAGVGWREAAQAGWQLARQFPRAWREQSGGPAEWAGIDVPADAWCSGVWAGASRTLSSLVVSGITTFRTLRRRRRRRRAAMVSTARARSRRSPQSRARRYLGRWPPRLSILRGSCCACQARQDRRRVGPSPTGRWLRSDRLSRSRTRGRFAVADPSRSNPDCRLCNSGAPGRPRVPSSPDGTRSGECIRFAGIAEPGWPHCHRAVCGERAGHAAPGADAVTVVFDGAAGV